jgi:hypothetical protein
MDKVVLAVNPKKYKKKPEEYYALQYDGTNHADIIAFCPECIYDAESKKLIFQGVITVDPTSWVLQDIAGAFRIMTDSQFISYFALV